MFICYMIYVQNDEYEWMGYAWVFHRTYKRYEKNDENWSLRMIWCVDIMWLLYTLFAWCVIGLKSVVQNGPHEMQRFKILADDDTDHDNNDTTVLPAFYLVWTVPFQIWIPIKIWIGWWLKWWINNILNNFSSRTHNNSYKIAYMS